MRIYHTYSELLEHVAAMDLPMRELGHCPDGSPIICVRSGGDKQPGIVISAGSHSTEHAGVSAAVELLEALDTEHRVYVIPTRDPIGLNGFAYALSLGLGELPDFGTYEELEAILRSKGEVCHEEEGLILALIGEYGFTVSRPGEGQSCAQYSAYLRLQDLEKSQPQILAPFRGRRIFMAPGQSGIEGSGDFGRAYTLIISPEGEVLHINRFHDTAWAPVEARCARNLLAAVQPGIAFDIHESQLMGDKYWLSARHMQDQEDEEWEVKIAHVVIQAIAESGATLAEDIDVLGVPIEETWFTRTERGVYWLDSKIRGEGLNLADFVARNYALSFGTEMGMYGSFAGRVELGMLTVQRAVSVFEERYR